MSYTSILTRIDGFLRPNETPFGELEQNAVQAAEQANASGVLDDWKVTWRRDGSFMGGITCAVLFGTISAVASVPLIITIMANNGIQTSLPIPGGVQVNVPSAMSGIAYKGGAWIGERVGFYIGWAAGACASEIVDLLEKTSSKLFQLAKDLFNAAMVRIGYWPDDAADEELLVRVELQVLEDGQVKVRLRMLGQEPELLQEEEQVQEQEQEPGTSSSSENGQALTSAFFLDMTPPGPRSNDDDGSMSYGSCNSHSRTILSGSLAVSAY